MVREKSTRWANQVLKLTDYHILGMCLVRSNAENIVIGKLKYLIGPASGLLPHRL